MTFDSGLTGREDGLIVTQDAKLVGVTRANISKSLMGHTYALMILV